MASNRGLRMTSSTTNRRGNKQQTQFPAPISGGTDTSVTSNSVGSGVDDLNNNNHNMGAENQHHEDGGGGMFSASGGLSAAMKSNIPSLVVAFLASLTTGGTTYAFGLYGAALKKALHLSQAQLDTISTANFCAGLFSWIPGLIVDRMGTRFALAAGGITGALALIAYWAVARQFIIVEWVVATLSFLGVTIFLSSALVTGSVFKIIVGTCGPGTKGSAVGVAKGYVGLGAGAYACLFQSIRTESESDLDFLPMAAFFCIFVVTMPSLLLLPSHNDFRARKIQDESTSNHFRVLYVSLVIMALFIVANSIISLFDDEAKALEDLKKQQLAEEPAVMALTAEDFTEADTAIDAGNVTFPPSAKAEYIAGTEQQEANSIPQYATASFLLTIWIAPIVALLFVPRRSHQPLLQQVPDPAVNSTTTASASVNEDLQDGDDSDIASPVEMTIENMDALTSRKTKSKNNVEHHDADQEHQPFLSESTNTNNNNNANLDDGDNAHNNNNNNHDYASQTTGSVQSVATRGANRNYNLLEMLQTPSAMLMLWSTTILVGAGTVETNNMGQMVESLQLPPVTTSAALAFFSVFQALARVFTGAVSESALNWTSVQWPRTLFIESGVPRPFFLVLASLAGFIAHGLLSFAVEKYSFVIGAALSGFAFGMVWPLMVLICGEVFGANNVGANYMFFDGFTSAAGTLLLSKIIAQDVYEDNIQFNPPEAEDNLTCIGTGCFQMTHIAVSILSLTCLATSYAMVRVSRDVYNKRSLHVA